MGVREWFGRRPVLRLLFWTPDNLFIGAFSRLWKLMSSIHWLLNRRANTSGMGAVKDRLFTARLIYLNNIFIATDIWATRSNWERFSWLLWSGVWIVICKWHLMRASMLIQVQSIYWCWGNLERQLNHFIEKRGRWYHTNFSSRARWADGNEPIVVFNFIGFTWRLLALLRKQ